MWSAVLMGFNDCVNPFALATALIYVLLLTTIRHTRFQLVISGLIFIITAWLINFFVLNGGYDNLIYKPFVVMFIKGLYFFITALFIFLGCVHIRDWWRYQKSDDITMFVLRSPRVITYDGTTKRIRYTLALMVLTFIVAWLLSICETRVTQNYYLFVMIAQRFKEDEALASVGVYICYILAYTLPLLIFWIYCVIDSCSLRVKTSLNQAVSLEKIIFAALYFACAISLIYYLIKVVRF